MDDSKTKYCLKCKKKLPKKLVKNGRRLCDSCVKSNENIYCIFFSGTEKFLETNWYEELLLINSYLWVRPT